MPHKNIVFYRATITPDNSQPNHYIGLTSTIFKERRDNHMHSFKTRSKSNATELSKYIWKLKDQNTNYSIKWSILQQATPYNPATKRCNLCLSEKCHILASEEKNNNFEQTFRAHIKQQTPV